MTVRGRPCLVRSWCERTPRRYLCAFGATIGSACAMWRLLSTHPVPVARATYGPEEGASSTRERAADTDHGARSPFFTSSESDPESANRSQAEADGPAIDPE